MNTQKENNSKEPKKKSTGKTVAVVLGIVAGVAIVGYFLWPVIKPQVRKNNEDEPVPYLSPAIPLLPVSSGGSSYIPKPQRNDDFPLKRGSKGERVTKLQQALIAK